MLSCSDLIYWPEHCSTTRSGHVTTICWVVESTSEATTSAPSSRRSSVCWTETWPICSFNADLEITMKQKKTLHIHVFSFTTTIIEEWTGKTSKLWVKLLTLLFIYLIYYIQLHLSLKIVYLYLSSFEQWIIHSDSIVNTFLVSKLNVSKPTGKRYQHGYLLITKIMNRYIIKKYKIMHHKPFGMSTEFVAKNCDSVDWSTAMKVLL